MNDAIRMQISAFVDGELPDAEADLLLRRMSQDAELRRKAAELRGERNVRGIDRLLERIAAEIDDKPMDDDVAAPASAPAKAIRPLAGIAVAASVALIAIFGLQVTPGVDDEVASESAVAETADDPGYTVPQQIDEQLRQYYLSHGASSSELGANGMNARLVSLRLSDEELSEEQAEDSDEADESADELQQP